MTTTAAGVTIDHGAVRVALCQSCEWRLASTSLAHVWTGAARHLRRDHGDLAGGRKALRAALTAAAREHQSYRLPHGIADDIARRGDDDLGGVASGALREPVGLTKSPRTLRPATGRAGQTHP